MTAFGSEASAPGVSLYWTHSAGCSCHTLATTKVHRCSGGRYISWSQSAQASAWLSNPSAGGVGTLGAARWMGTVHNRSRSPPPSSAVLLSAVPRIEARSGYLRGWLEDRCASGPKECGRPAARKDTPCYHVLPKKQVLPQNKR